jgi:hypothetical protein
LSGYGASSFSAWTDPTAKDSNVVQARFNMMVGRTNHEVVQIQSRLHPWCAIVVRTITIDRQDDGEVNRYDSGWRAATPGIFGCPGITVHPGAVRGAYNIRNISDTTQTFTFGGVELVGVYFDADIQIDGVVSGAINGLVPSTDQFGFVQVAGSPLTPGDLRELIDNEGALGGPVDCVISVGGTAQTMRLSRVEVGTAPHPEVGPVEFAVEFAAAARGSLVLPQPGSWSVLARTDSVSEPTPIDPDLGVPLIQQGPAGSPVPNAPWRLAEPVDLLAPDSPSMDYCLLHATDSTRMLFPRPKIAAGASAFTSDVVPLLADGFALMGATSVCPRQDTCLAFPNANYQLQIGAAGAFTLANVPDPFAPSLPNRTLASGTAAALGFEYADETGTPCQASVTIQPNAWSVGLKGVNVRLDLAPFTGLMRTVGDVEAASGNGVSFGNARLVMGSVLQPVQDLISGFEKLGLPAPFRLSFSNSGWTPSTKLMAVLDVDIDAPQLPKPDEIEIKLGFGNAPPSLGALFTASSQWVATFDFKIVWNLGWPPPPAGAWVGILNVDVVFAAGTTQGSQTLKLQLGIAASGSTEPIPNLVKVKALIAATLTLVYIPSTSPPSLGLGIGLILDASGEIGSGPVAFAQVQFTAEFDALVFVTAKPIFFQGTFDVQLDVTVCWCLNVNFEDKFQFTANL